MAARKALVVTEKPSVARDIVGALGGLRSVSGGDYWEGDAYIVTFAVGHLLSLFEPEDIDPRYRAWKMEDLPILPECFCLKPVPKQEKRLQVIGRLLKRADVDLLINACDAAREGELIFREIVDYFECTKPVERLWLQSMTPAAIKRGFDSLRKGSELDGLGHAARCRARSDWLVGMNASRAFSLKLRRGADRSPWSVGRVQTPTLALLVKRELEILGHVPTPYWRVKADFRAQDHTYEGVWYDPKIKVKAGEFTKIRSDRIFSKEVAEDLVEKIRGKSGQAHETRETSERKAPPLFNLTSMQRHMSSRYRWSSKRTLEAAQRCYESHKVITYPRTSSSCLPNDYRGEVQMLFERFASNTPYGEHASYLLKHGCCNEKRTFNDDLVSDHFAIIPTGQFRELPGDDGRLFDEVVRRFLANFFPPALYDKVRRQTIVEGEHFRTGPLETLREPGWQKVYGKEAKDRSENSGQPRPELPPLVAGPHKSPNGSVGLQEVRVEEELTKPPPRVSEARLLSLMETAGRQVEDEALAEALISAEGLGTAATRADIIQNLKQKQYVDDQLRPTPKGIRLIEVLRGLGADRLISAELTAQLELKLSEVERGQLDAGAFMDELVVYTKEVVDRARGFDERQLFRARHNVGPCPRCKANGSSRDVVERSSHYVCSEASSEPRTKVFCRFHIPKDVKGRYLDRASVGRLLVAATTGELTGFKDEAGRDYSGEIILENGKAFLIAKGLKIDLEEQASLRVPKSSRQRKPSGRKDARKSWGQCPIHKGGSCQILETTGAYICETRLQDLGEGRSAPIGFLFPKKMCGRTLDQAELQDYQQNGFTGWLDGFVSKRGRAFTARLRMSATGSPEFEFRNDKDSEKRREETT